MILIFMKLLFSFLILCLSLLYNKTQISEKTFFEKYYKNTTKVDFYGNSSVYLYLNDKYYSSHYINFLDHTQFLKKLKKSDIDILYQKDYQTSNYLLLFCFLFMLLSSKNILTSRFSNYIKMNNKVQIKS